jgi:hypothetical protein
MNAALPSFLRKPCVPRLLARLTPRSALVMRKTEQEGKNLILRAQREPKARVSRRRTHGVFATGARQ